MLIFLTYFMEYKIRLSEFKFYKISNINKENNNYFIRYEMHVKYSMGLNPTRVL